MPRSPCTIDLALQGGGAHGAFTWGVLDRLLEETWLEIGGISGTSAGAMNAVVLADGLLKGGRRAARRALWSFWKAVSRSARQVGWQANPYAPLFGDWVPPASPFYAMTELWTRIVSPYQFNPLNLNPLRDILLAQIDFAALRAAPSPCLFVAATSVATGGLRLFRNAELTADAVMASACLPMLFHAVDVGGEPYWDGGYAGNPALLPLVAESPPRDLVLVQINPRRRAEEPRTAAAIQARINEITFNNSLLKDLRTIALLKQTLAADMPICRDEDRPLFRQVEQLLVHRIAADESLAEADIASRLNPQWQFLVKLHGVGRRAAGEWLDRHADDVGRRATVDVVAEFG